MPRQVWEFTVAMMGVRLPSNENAPSRKLLGSVLGCSVDAYDLIAGAATSSAMAVAAAIENAAQATARQQATMAAAATVIANGPGNRSAAAADIAAARGYEFLDRFFVGLLSNVLD